MSENSFTIETSQGWLKVFKSHNTYVVTLYYSNSKRQRRWLVSRLDCTKELTRETAVEFLQDLINGYVRADATA